MQPYEKREEEEIPPDHWLVEWENDDCGPSMTGYIVLAPGFSERIPLVDYEGDFDEIAAQSLCDQLNELPELPTP